MQFVGIESCPRAAIKTEVKGYMKTHKKYKPTGYGKASEDWFRAQERREILAFAIALLTGAGAVWLIIMGLGLL